MVNDYEYHGAPKYAMDNIQQIADAVQKGL